MNGAPLPLWVVALVLATVAPFAAKTLATAFERRSHERSRRLLNANAKANDIDEMTSTD